MSSYHRGTCFHQLFCEVNISMKQFEGLHIDKTLSEPISQQFFNEFVRLIENEALKPDEKLPSIRGLATFYKVNAVTIVNAYKMLAAKGLIYSKGGSGTFVRNNQNLSILDAEPVERKSETPSTSTSTSSGEGMLRDYINFASSTPDPALFPIREFKDILNEVLDRDGGFAFGYQDSQGYYPLRRAIAEYLDENGIKISPDSVQIISGAQQGIDIVAKALVNMGDVVLVERPTYSGAIAAFRSRGAKILEVGMEEDGIDLQELESILKMERPKIIYTMTNFQNPTGCSYSDVKKAKLLKLADTYGFFILEDDYLSELRFYGEKGIPIKSIDVHNRVIYLKSFSKIFMPGIRIAFMITPEPIGNKILSAKHMSDISTGGLMQRAMELYLKNRIWENHIVMMWGIFKERYDKLVHTIRTQCPFMELNEPMGGLYLWVETDVDSSRLYHAAMEKGIKITPGAVFYGDHPFTNHFRISFGGVNPEEMEEGILRLKEAYFAVKDSGEGY